MSMEKKVVILGTETGEVCNRDGCKGIIEETKKSGTCSCHINPPCSYCVDDNHYCPACDWQGIDDQKNYPIPAAQGLYNRMMQREETYVDKIEKMRSGKLPIEKLTWYPKGHTHFSMYKIGVYPDGMNRADVEKELVGCFGGRFEQFGNGKFTYIAYTD